MHLATERHTDGYTDRQTHPADSMTTLTEYRSHAPPYRQIHR